MDLEDPPLLYILIGEVAVGVTVLHVGQEVIQILDLVDGVDEDQDLGVLDEAEVGDHEGDAFLLSHQHVLLLQVLRNVDFLVVELSPLLLLSPLSLLLLDIIEADVLWVVHGEISQQRLHLLVEVR